MTILSSFTSKSKQIDLFWVHLFSFLIGSHASPHSAVRQKCKTQIRETEGENLIGVQAEISYLRIDVYAYANVSLFSCIYCMSYEIISEAVLLPLWKEILSTLMHCIHTDSIVHSLVKINQFLVLSLPLPLKLTTLCCRPLLRSHGHRIVDKSYK